jgi:hypothetical protein
MRRVVGFVLVALGICGIVLAPLLHFVAYPKVQLFPLDQNFTDYASGPGTYLDFTDLKIKGPATLTVCRTATGDVKEGLNKTDNPTGAAVWDVVTYIQLPGTKLCGGPDQAYSVTTERWAFDRTTVQGQQFAGVHPNFTKSNAYLVFPFNVDTSKTYSYWDSTAEAAYPAKYEGTEQLLGRTVDKFVSVVPPTPIQLAQPLGSVVGGDPAGKYDVYYANPESVALVDPLTGVVVGGSSHLVLTARLEGQTTDAGTILDVQLKERSDSVQKLTQLAIDNGNKLKLISTVLPLILLVGGIVLLVLGFWLSRPAGTAPRRLPAPSPDPEPAAAGPGAA